jgi:hypothetical protein
MKKKNTGLMFFIGGFIFLIISAIQYFTGYPHPTALLTLGIAFIVIGFAARSKYKGEDKEHSKII